MQNTTMLKLPLYLNGHYAGKTIKLSDIEFTNGKVVLYGVASEVGSLADYLGKCYQAWPEGKRLNPETGEIIYEEVSKNGSSEIQATGRGDVSGKIREEERQAKEVPSDERTGTVGANLDERGGDTDRSGHADPRVHSPEERFRNSSAAKIAPEKLLEAMGKLDPANADHWRRDGLPKVDAVAKLYGSEGLTRNDLNAVWPELTKDLKRGEDSKVS